MENIEKLQTWFNQHHANTVSLNQPYWIDNEDEKRNVDQELQTLINNIKNNVIQPFIKKHQLTNIQTDCITIDNKKLLIEFTTPDTTMPLTELLNNNIDNWISCIFSGHEKQH